MIRIILTSDLHLDSQNQDSPVRNREKLNTFRKIVTLAADYDLLLIAGDLFDSASPKKETLEEVITQITRLREKGTIVIFVPGEQESTPEFEAIMGNIPFDKVFTNAAADSVFPYLKEAQQIYIHGAPALSPADITAVEKKPDDGFHIGLYHARFDRADDESGAIAGIRKEDIRKLQLDFYALGHNHTFRLYKYADRIIGAYPGSPEAVNDSETGDRYVLSLTIEDNRLSQIKRLTINSILLIEHQFDCGEASSSELTAFLEKTVSSRTALKLTLSGERTFQLPPNLKEKYSGRLYSLEIKDRTTVPLELLAAEMSSENSLRGTFYSLLKERIDKTAVPDDLDRSELADILSAMTRDGITYSEEWVCALFNA